MFGITRRTNRIFTGLTSANFHPETRPSTFVKVVPHIPRSKMDPALRRFVRLCSGLLRPVLTAAEHHRWVNYFAACFGWLEESFLAESTKVLESDVDSPPPEMSPRSCRFRPRSRTTVPARTIASHTAAPTAGLTYIAARSVLVAGVDLKS